MHEDHGRGVVVQGLLDDDPRVHRRPVDGAVEEFGHPDQAMAGVKKDYAEDLVAPARELQAQELLDVPRRVHGAAAAEAPRQHLQGEGDDGGLFGARQRGGGQRMESVFAGGGGIGWALDSMAARRRLQH